jgi:gamma-glutamylcyclotransferase (GGCT)/AIG2-like uncharacterized protein YtfP
MSGLSQQWSDEEFRRRLVAGLREWNSAQSAGWTEQLRAADQIKQVFERDNSAAAAPDSSVSATRHTRQSAAPETPAQTVDLLLDFPSRRLAVYGSLGPGKKNHHVIAGIRGRWRKAIVRGSLHNEGWGAGEGFPGFFWDGTNTPVAAQVFSSRELPHYWPQLDEFEGAEYRRILVPAEILGGGIEICNVYALAKRI